MPSYSWITAAGKPTQENKSKTNGTAERSDRIHSETLACLKPCCTSISCTHSERHSINQAPTHTSFQRSAVFHTPHYTADFRAVQGYTYMHAADAIKRLPQCKRNSGLSKCPIFRNQPLSIPLAHLWHRMTKITCSVYSQNIHASLYLRAWLNKPV